MGTLTYMKVVGTKTMMDFPTQHCCQACESRCVLEENERKGINSKSMRISQFSKSERRQSNPKLPSWSSTMLAKTNVLTEQKMQCPISGHVGRPRTPMKCKYLHDPANKHPHPCPATIDHIRRTSCSDCTHLEPDHQTAPVRLRHCSVAGAAFSLARYWGPQDRLGHLPQRRKC